MANSRVPPFADSGRCSVSWHVGAITGACAFAMFLLAPQWGRLSDRVGRRPVMLVGLGKEVEQWTRL